MQKVVYALLLLTLSACGQPPVDRINENIKNTKTTRHVNIPGTRLFLVAPVNFVQAKTFVGLQKGEAAALNVYDLVGGNYYTNAATFSKDAFEKRGAKILDYKEIKINGYPAKFIHVQGDPTTKTIALVFGDTTFSAMIMAIYQVNDETTGKEIIASLNTIFYDKAKKIDPFETAFFSIDESASAFKFYQYNANIYMYSTGGKDPKNDPVAPMALVTQLPNDDGGTAVQVTERMAAKALEYGMTGLTVKNQKTEKINGIEASQAEIYGQMEGHNSMIYICSFVKDDKAVVLQGVAKNDLETNLSEFKKLAHTITIK